MNPVRQKGEVSEGHRDFSQSSSMVSDFERCRRWKVGCRNKADGQTAQISVRPSGEHGGPEEGLPRSCL